jgi:hypothetical protein
MTRVLCLGMSALDAIYRVPAIPSTPTKVAFVYLTKGGQAYARQAGKGPRYLERLRGFFLVRVGSGLCAGGVVRNRIAMSSIVTCGGSGGTTGVLRGVLMGQCSSCRYDQPETRARQAFAPSSMFPTR